MGILDTNLLYKPVKYNFALAYYMAQNSNHWTIKNIKMNHDLENFMTTKSDTEKYILLNVLKSFVQSDIEVNLNYLTILPNIFKNTHLRMMFSAFANIESMHVVAYDLLITSLPDHDPSIYEAFNKYSEIKDRFDFLDDFRKAQTVEEIALACAVFGAFTEGVLLFASFAILLNFSRFGEMEGVHHVLKYSILDESLHVEAMIKLYHVLCFEYQDQLDMYKLRNTLVNHGKKVVELEKKYMDFIFSKGELPTMNRELMHKYLEYICDNRFKSLHIQPVYHTKNPLPWIDDEILSPALTNFFDKKSTDYSHNSKDFSTINIK